MAMNKGLLRTVRSFSARHLTRRSFVTENLKNEDVNNKDSKISVWWDIQRCDVPIYRHAGTFIRNVRVALRRRIHCSGPVEIWAYADMRSALPKTLIELHNSGVRLRHVPKGNGLKYHVMVADMIAWTAGNPPPAVAAVITGDNSGVLYDETPLEDLMDELRVQGYNIQHCLPEMGDPYEIPNAVWPPAIKEELPPPIKEEELPWRWETFWPASTK